MQQDLASKPKIILCPIDHIFVLLLEKDFEILVVKTAEEILPLAQQPHPPDCIIATYSLISSNLKLLKTNFFTAHIPLILLFNTYDQLAIESAITAGADDYLIIPSHSPSTVSPYKEESIIRHRVAINIFRSQRDLDVNPLTRLPGNRVIAKVLHERLDKQAVALHIDINNFKNYNDTYGFLEGDKIILQTARLLAAILNQHGNTTDFLGHVGGDDFIIVTQRSTASYLKQQIENSCAQEIKTVAFSIVVFSRDAKK